MSKKGLWFAPFGSMVQGLGLISSFCFVFLCLVTQPSHAQYGSEPRISDILRDLREDSQRKLSEVGTLEELDAHMALYREVKEEDGEAVPFYPPLELDPMGLPTLGVSVEHLAPQIEEWAVILAGIYESRFQLHPSKSQRKSLIRRVLRRTHLTLYDYRVVSNSLSSKVSNYVDLAFIAFTYILAKNIVAFSYFALHPPFDFIAYSVVIGSFWFIPDHPLLATLFLYLKNKKSSKTLKETYGITPELYEISIKEMSRFREKESVFWYKIKFENTVFSFPVFVRNPVTWLLKKISRNNLLDFTEIESFVDEKTKKAYRMKSRSKYHYGKKLIEHILRSDKGSVFWERLLSTKSPAKMNQVIARAQALVNLIEGDLITVNRGALETLIPGFVLSGRQKKIRRVKNQLRDLADQTQKLLYEWVVTWEQRFEEPELSAKNLEELVLLESKRNYLTEHLYLLKPKNYSDLVSISRQRELRCELGFSIL